MVSGGGGINIGVIRLRPSDVRVSICLLIGPLTDATDIEFDVERPFNIGCVTSVC